MMPTNERFVRWQATTIAQFGFVNNLLIALATTALGFALTQVAKTTVANYGRLTMWLSIVALLVSVTCGVGCAIHRLIDFRSTARIARDELGNEEKAITREYVALVGMASWRLFYVQVGAFVAGAILLILSVALQVPN
jgi:hypothetical protein